MQQSIIAPRNFFRDIWQKFENIWQKFGEISTRPSGNIAVTKRNKQRFKKELLRRTKLKLIQKKIVEH
jgi:hypothetical protein